MMEYAEAFKKGRNYVIFESEPEERTFPILDKGDLKSIGYYDGYQYGEYLEMTSQTMSISDEQLIAVISKAYWRAIDDYHEEIEYLPYKNGFLSGRDKFTHMVIQGAENLNMPPEINEEDNFSLGYYDGYVSALYSQAKNIPLNDEMSDTLIRNCFKQRKLITNHTLESENTK